MVSAGACLQARMPLLRLRTVPVFPALRSLLRQPAQTGRTWRIYPPNGVLKSGIVPSQRYSYSTHIAVSPDMEPESSTSTSNPELKRQSVEDSADAQPAEKKPRVENTASADGVPDTEAAALEGLSDADSGKGKKQQLSRRAAARVRMDDRKQGKRRAGTRTEREPTPDNGEPKEGRLPKRMCALLIGFCGSGYSGMQRCVPLYIVETEVSSACLCCRQGRPEVKTIEDTLFNALVKAGAVSKDNSDSPSKVRIPSSRVSKLLMRSLG